ncbi:hypothetical protein HDU76_004330, partial [Blyttiomyces sp. JEL0837]
MTNEFYDLYNSMKEVAEESVQAHSNPDKVSVRTGVLVLSDERANPYSDQFDHIVFMKATRQFMSRMGMEYARMPVVLDNLRVYGNALANTQVPTIGSSLQGLFHPVVRLVSYLNSLIDNNFVRSTQKKTKELLHGITGSIKPGELVLVIGRPGSGCSTLLRTLSNRTLSFKEIKGTISFGGFTPDEIHEKYRGEVVYAEEKDPHHPSLTVRQTLDFALQCRVPDAVARKNLIQTILKLYGLVNIQNTKIGDAFLRGVSGGEKKRVTLAEATCIGGSVAAFDACTTGLDSASALDFVRALRNMADFQEHAVVASCYQASDAMFDLFDKVIVLSEGYCVYQGPVSNAVEYFESLGFAKRPRDTKVEFLTISASDKKMGPAELGRIYAESTLGRAIKADVKKNLDPTLLESLRNDFKKSIEQRKVYMKTTKQVDSPFNVPFSVQVRLLIIRELQIIYGNPWATILRLIFPSLMGTIIGSVYYKLPLDVTGTLSRGSILFFALMFSSSSATVEITKIMANRPVLNKHVDFALYRPSTYILTQYILNIWQDTLEVFTLGVPIYWMSGLQPSISKFLFYFLTVFVTSQTFNLLLRAITNCTEDVNTATIAGITTSIFFVVNMGYLIPEPSMNPAFIWIFKINPIAYGFKSAMINEFSGLSFSCDVPGYLIPFGPTYSNMSHQTCIVPGSKPGDDFVDGTAYLQANLSMDPNSMWWNLFVVLGMGIVFLVANCVIIEFIQHDKAGVSVKLYNEKKSRRNQTIDLEQRGSDKFVTFASTLQGKSYMEDPDKDSINTLSWKDVEYRVPHPKDKKSTLQLLDKVSAYAKPGTLTALMGSSGAGKTTLLDVVAQRKTIGTISGSILVGSRPQNANFKRLSGYCEQMDILNSNSTVREALRFSAYLRQPKSKSKKEKDEYCEQVIDLLDLRSLADALIGDLYTGIGLTMEERKRVSIGIELAAKPKILFLDEPTSGLDEQASVTIIGILKNLAAQGHALLVTIHQPSAMLFTKFDRLLLLGRGGKTIYFGELGDDCQTMISYFERHGAHKCEPTANPAEYMLDCIGAGTAKVSNTTDWFNIWNESPEAQQELSTIDDIRTRAENYSKRIKLEELANSTEEKLSAPKTEYMSDFQKTRLVMARMFQYYWRSVEYNIGRVVFQIMVGLIIGLMFFQPPNTPTGVRNKIFGIFTTIVTAHMVILNVQPMFFTQRNYAIRETNSGTYSLMSFAFAISLIEFPFAVCAATSFFLSFYFLAGLSLDVKKALFFYIT